MRALVWNAVESMVVEEIEQPTPRSDEVVLRVEAVGICGSELEGYLGHNSLRFPPLIMGHEFCGRVTAVGESARGINVGERAIVNPLISCGHCARCAAGLPQLCAQRAIIGINRPGGFAECVAVPAGRLVSIPEDLSPWRAALAEPLACAVRATRRAMAEHPFSNVLVFGAGGIGLLAAKVARLLGAEATMIADTNMARLGIAREVGIDHTVHPGENDLAGEIRTAFGSKGVDVVIDAAGFQPTREAAVAVLNPGGTLMNIGLGIDHTSLPINVLTRGEMRILTSFCYSHQDFMDAIGLLRGGKITETGWTEVRPFEAGPQAFADLVAGRVNHGRVVLDVQAHGS